MQKTALFIIVFIVTCFCSPHVSGVPLDFVVMVDTSNSMEVYFDDLVQYIITDILKENLRPGDTFHLIRFSELPVHELTQVITDPESTDAILKKIYFLKAKLLFGKYTDILASLKFLVLYAEGLSKRNNKKLLLLSDFINNPAKDSPYAGISLKELEEELKIQAKTIREREGWSIHFIRFPANGTSDEDRTDIVRMDPAEKNRDEDSISPGDKDQTDSRDKDRIQPEDKDNIRQDDEDVTQPGDKDRTRQDDTDRTQPEDKERTGTDDGETIRTGDDDNKEQDVLDIISDTFEVDIPTFDKNGKDDPAIKKSGFPRLEFPGNLGRQGREFNVPFIIHNYLDEDIIIELSTLEYSGKNLLTNKVPPKFIGPGKSKKIRVKIRIPADAGIIEGPYELPVVLTFNDDYRIAPREGILSFYYTGNAWIAFFRFIGENFSMIITILIVVSILLIIFIFIRMRVFEGVFSDLFSSSEWSKTTGTIPEGESLIEMRVTFQNPHIGYRNIHKIDENKTFTVGGGFSAFLIFLIPIPPHIAEIENIAGNYIFTPVKMDFFPDLKGPVENCLNKEIPIVSKHGYRTYITFKEYESPLSRLNKLLHSVRQEG
ncbi:MAG: VWA domain-containing protein [Spirochaetales bacterium]|nr:VWA domain-containing protein [Spirochaetales bacterium]